jgi:hypothetical protein
MTVVVDQSATTEQVLLQQCIGHISPNSVLIPVSSLKQVHQGDSIRSRSKQKQTSKDLFRDFVIKDYLASCYALHCF